jgi:hypothetical protein
MSDFYMDELAKYYRMRDKKNLTIRQPLLLSGPKSICDTQWQYYLWELVKVLVPHKDELDMPAE